MGPFRLAQHTPGHTPITHRSKTESAPGIPSQFDSTERIFWFGDHQNCRNAFQMLSGEPRMQCKYDALLQPVAQSFPTTHAWLKSAARSFHPMKTRFCPAEISYFWCQARKTVLCGFRLVPQIKYRDSRGPCRSSTRLHVLSPRPRRNTKRTISILSLWHTRG